MRYRRARVAGGTYFFTVNLAERDRTLLVDHVDLLRSAMGHMKAGHPFNIDAVVILPDHLHTIWTLPEGDCDYPVRWALIKAGFSRRISSAEQRNESRFSKGERGIWQRRYWEHVIRDELDYERHVDYIHYNPVKHSHAHRSSDWPHSSIHRQIAAGRADRDWGAEPVTDKDRSFGEK
jgi:putative transposase